MAGWTCTKTSGRGTARSEPLLLLLSYNCTWRVFGRVGLMFGVANQLSLALGMGTLAGLNLYLTILVLGLLLRFNWLPEVSVAYLSRFDFLATTPVLVAAFILAGFELVTSKFKLTKTFKHIWDALHLVIKPVGSAIIMTYGYAQAAPTPAVVAEGSLRLQGLFAGGAQVATEASYFAFPEISGLQVAFYSLSAVAAALVISLVRFAAHFAVWLSPIPFVDALISIAEDAATLALAVIFVFWPNLAIAIVLMLLLISTLLLVRVLRFELFLGRFLLRWLSSWRTGNEPGLVELPRDGVGKRIARLLEGRQPQLVQPAAIRRWPGLPKYCRCLLVVDGERLLAVFRRWGLVSHCELAPEDVSELLVKAGLVLPSLCFQYQDRQHELYLPRDARAHAEDIARLLGGTTEAPPDQLEATPQIVAAPA